MDFQLIAAIIFFAVLSLILYLKKENLNIEKAIYPLLYFIMYRTQIGINAMDRIAKAFPRLIRVIALLGIITGFGGMVLIAGMLVYNLYSVLFIPGAVSGVVPVLPFKMKGVFYVPFFYWIICIFIIAVVHEFSHGVVARMHGIKIRSSGFAFLAVFVPVIPAAFVEPDEKILGKRPKSQQLGVFAAGPFSNIVFAFLVLGLIYLVFNPGAHAITENNGVLVLGLDNATTKYPAELAGMNANELITEVDGTSILTYDDFSKLLEDKRPGDTISVKTNVSVYSITLAESPNDPEKPYLGIFPAQSWQVKEESEQRYGFLIDVFMWVFGLFYLLFMLSLGIGLFNLVPLGPIDGGRMLLLGLQHVLGQQRGEQLWKQVSVFFLGLIAVNLILAFVL